MATLTSRLLAERIPQAGGLRAKGGSQWRSLARAAAVFTLIGSAVIHFSHAGVHLKEWRPAGITFLALAGAELALAAWLLVGASRVAYLLGIWVSQATVLLWGLSRTVGIPFGPDAFVPEPLGRPDLTSTVLEAITLVVLLPLLLSRAAGNGEIDLSRSGYVAVGVMAILVGSSTWVAVLPATGCGGHEASELLTGPMIPIDGHSMLGRNTPVVEAEAGKEVGLVVGLLNNCGTSTLTVESAGLTGATNFAMAGRSVSFWVVPPSLAQPGLVIPVDVLKRTGMRLPGRVEVEPAKGSTRYPGLVLLVDAIRPGDVFVNAVEVTYTTRERRYSSPYATIARLRISS